MKIFFGYAMHTMHPFIKDIRGKSEFSTLGPDI